MSRINSCVVCDVCLSAGYFNTTSLLMLMFLLPARRVRVNGVVRF